MTTRYQQRTAGQSALPFSTHAGCVPASRGVLLVFAAALLFSGCGAQPQSPTAPIRTHLEDAVAALPRLPATTPWQRFAFNDWEQLRARAGLGDTPVATWTVGAHSKESDTLQGWLLAPGSLATASALMPFGLDAATIRWQAALDGADGRPVTRLITAPARDDRPQQVGAALAPLGYHPAATANGQATVPVVFTRGASGATALPVLLDSDAAALVATPTALVTVHDATRLPDVVAALSPDGANLDTVPFFHGLTVGVSDIEAMIV
ncbi:MAG: hypothetical protein LC793_06280, partial [Thermomicrobia bacterium]|nr:hypothetical protein [Thermomicrobia bacterium]